VVTYLIREQFYHFTPRAQTLEDSWPKRLEYSLYVLSLKEWNLDSFMYRWLWNPMKAIGRGLDRFTIRRMLLLFVPLYVLGGAGLFMEEQLPAVVFRTLPVISAFIAVVMVLRSFTERHHVRRALLMIIMGHFWVALAVSYNEHYNLGHSVLYLSGVVVSGTVAYLAIDRLRRTENQVNLRRFHGHVFEHPRLALVFLLACLGLAGFPITTTFIGEDLIFTHIHAHDLLLAGLVSLCFVIDGIALIRLYARVFLGPHVKTYHEVADRSS